MTPYCFFSNRQLIFYININGQQRLVKFGERDTFGVSAFQTTNPYTAEAIRKSSLFKKGVIREESKMEEEPKPAVMKKVEKVPVATGQVVTEPVVTEPVVTDPITIEPSSGSTTDAGDSENVIEAKNFTQAKSMLAKKLNIKYNDIKTPAQMMQLAKDAGITLKY